MNIAGSRSCGSVRAQRVPTVAPRAPAAGSRKSRFHTVAAVLGGGGAGGGGGDKKIIIPGSGGGGGAASGGRGGSGGGLIGMEGDSIRGSMERRDAGKFRLPKGFMDTTPAEREVPEEEQLTTEEMLDRLQEKSGYWYEMAKYVSLLQRDGVDTGIIEEIAGISSLEQNFMVGSSSVFATLQEREVAAEILEHFTYNDGDRTLYPLRYLTAVDRQSAAEYIYNNGLDEKKADELVRAMREHERRHEKNFEYTPGDCMAFKYYRDAIEETRNEDQRQLIIEQGLAVATSEGGKAMLQKLLEKKKDEDEEVKGRINIVELDIEEVDTCLLSVAGELGEVDLASFVGASSTDRDGPFGILTTKAEGQRWVALPMFGPLVKAKDPVAVSVQDLSVLSDFGAQTDSAAMLVFDRQVKRDQIDLKGLYLISMDDKGTSYVSGAELLAKVELVGESFTVCGECVIACKPPGKKRDTGDAVAVVGN